jgi:hypothetical protein
MQSIAMKMTVFNLFFLKSKNGMYYYALDYIRQIKPRDTTYVLLNKKFFNDVPSELANTNVKLVHWYQLYFILIHQKANFGLIFTPTPHPIPFIRNQCIVFHDLFPFYGLKGWLKFFLFKVASYITNIRIGYINRSILLPFVNEEFSHCKTVFLPNIPSFNNNPDTPIAFYQKNQATLNIGFFGTDSKKKRYHEFLQLCPASSNLKFSFYGPENSYTKELKECFPNLTLIFIDSAKVEPEEFIKGVHSIASIALYEGFGRLNLLALSLGKNIFLLDTPVNKEFFGPDMLGKASKNCFLFQDVGQLLHNIQIVGVRYNPIVKIDALSLNAIGSENFTKIVNGYTK